MKSIENSKIIDNKSRDSFILSHSIFLSFYFLYFSFHTLCLFIFSLSFFPLNFPQYVTWMKDQSIRQKEKLAQSSFGSTRIPLCFSSHTWTHPLTPLPPPPPKKKKLTHLPTHPQTHTDFFTFWVLTFPGTHESHANPIFLQVGSHFFSLKSNYWWSLFYLIIKKV